MCQYLFSLLDQIYVDEETEQTKVTSMKTRAQGSSSVFKTAEPELISFHKHVKGLVTSYLV